MKIINSYGDLLSLKGKYIHNNKYYIFNTFFFQNLEKEMNDKLYNYIKYSKRFEKKKVKK